MLTIILFGFNTSYKYFFRLFSNKLPVEFSNVQNILFFLLNLVLPRIKKNVIPAIGITIRYSINGTHDCYERFAQWRSNGVR